jgi:hypothetical protein
MRKISNKIIKKNTNVCLIFFFSENTDVYEIMRKNATEPDRPQLII